MTLFNTNRRLSALVIGVSLLVMAVAAGIAFGAIHSSLIDMAQPERTMKNLLANSTRWQIEIVLWVVIIMTDLLVSWGVYHYYMKYDRKLSAITAVFRVIYTLFLSVAVSQLIGSIAAIQNGDSYTLMLLLDRFDRLWSFGLMLFGFHLILLSIETLKYENRIIGILLGIAGISYLLIHALNSFLPNLSDLTVRLEAILMIPMTIGEMVFAVWIIIRGGKSKRKAVS